MAGGWCCRCTTRVRLAQPRRQSPPAQAAAALPRPCLSCRAHPTPSTRTSSSRPRGSRPHSSSSSRQGPGGAHLPCPHLRTHHCLEGDRHLSPCGLCSRLRPRGRRCCPTAPRRQLGLGGCSSLRPWRPRPLAAFLRVMRTICWLGRWQTWRRRNCLPVGGESPGRGCVSGPGQLAGQASGGR